MAERLSASISSDIAAGEPNLSIARDLGISRETVYQYLGDLRLLPGMNKSPSQKEIRAGVNKLELCMRACVHA